jgi:hypothetical protein
MDNNNNENKPSYTNFIITFGISLASFSWAFYKFPIFRRDVIQASFDTADYIYDVYHKLRYDDKIRRESILKTNNNNSSNNNHNTKYFFTSQETGKEIETETESNSHKKTLVEFLSNELKFESLRLKEKQYYILGTKKENDLFTNDKIIEFPWLAASLDIINFDNIIHNYDVTANFKNFWIEHNQLPFHLEYYDIWISELISKNNSNFPAKEEIKTIKLNVIDALGDFIEYSDVLIEPSKDETRIINFPKMKENEEKEKEKENI